MVQKPPFTGVLSSEATRVFACTVMLGQSPFQVIGVTNVAAVRRVVEEYVDKVPQAPPVGLEGVHVSLQ